MLLLANDIEVNPGPIKHNLKLCHINIRSLARNFCSLQTCIPQDMDIITLSETFLNANSNISSLKLDGYKKIEYKNRTNQLGGGVGIYIKSHIISHRKYEFEINNLEAMWHEIKIGCKTILLCTCYRPPNSGSEFWEFLQESLDLALQSQIANIVVMGDLNADPKTYDGKKLAEFTAANNLFINVHKPTRITHHSATILDQLLTSHPNLASDIQVEPPIARNDHCTVTALLNAKHKCDPAFSRIIWDYKYMDLPGLKKYLNSTNWDECFETNDADLASKSWGESFLNAVRMFVPNKVITIRPKDKPWYNNNLRKLKRKVIRYFRLAKSSGNEFRWNTYKTLNNQYHDMIADAKLKMERNIDNMNKN